MILGLTYELFISKLSFTRMCSLFSPVNCPNGHSFLVHRAKDVEMGKREDQVGPHQK